MGLDFKSMNYQKCAMEKLFEFCGSESSLRDGIDKSISQKLFTELAKITYF